MKETLSVRPWTESDIEYVYQSVAGERWRLTRRDVKRCWHLEPNGCFVAELQSKPVGHVSTICYGKLSWIGLLIVNQEKRGRGIGTTLMQKAIDYLEGAGVETIRLEAEEAAVPLYRRLGFEEEFDSFRFVGHSDVATRQSFGEEMARMRRDDLELLGDFDARYFGCDRLRVLRELFEGGPGYCFVAKKERKLLGYVMCREIQGAFWIGPWICEDSMLAGKLLEMCAGSIKVGRVELHLGIPSPNETMSMLLKRKGFAFTGKTIRMFRGEKKHQGIPRGVCGIGGAAKG